MTQPTDETLKAAEAPATDAVVTVDAAPSTSEPARMYAAPEIVAPKRWSLPRAKLPRIRLRRLRALPRANLSALKARINPGAVPRPALAAAALLVALGAGFGAGRVAGRASSAEIDAAVQRLNQASAELRQGQDATLRLAGDIKAVKASVDTLKGDRGRGEVIARQDKAEKVANESAARLAKLAEQVDRMEKTQRDPARINAILERMERLEGRIPLAAALPMAQPPQAAATTSAAPTPPPKPGAAEPVQTGSLPDAKIPAKTADADPRRTQIEGFVLRDIDEGVALIEGRNGRFYEVSRGMNLPGIGRVEAVERRGRQWVVVTPKGYIGER